MESLEGRCIENSYNALLELPEVAGALHLADLPHASPLFLFPFFYLRFTLNMYK